jgi:hypothetical protein
MVETVLALRRYPTAMIMIMVLFFGSLLIAANSIGAILQHGSVIHGGGGDDQGSGMGGTGKTGLPGDSGFGGTGGPSPFLGDAGSGNENNQQDDSTTSNDSSQDWPLPWIPREQETAVIPAEIIPLMELRQNPPQDPFRNTDLLSQGEPDALRVLDPNDSTPSLYLRQLIELADSEDLSTETPKLEISLQIPEIPAPEPLSLPLFQQEAQPTTDELATNNAEQLPEILTETSPPDPRQNSGRAQRPELPPFQRLRPAVDRATVAPSRPQPMRI